MNTAFLRSWHTRRILFYLTVVCNLAACSFNVSKSEDETRLVSGCRYTYPNNINPYSYTPLVQIDLIACSNMLVNELPFYENVTKMELINVPISTLNDTEIPKAIRSERVDLRNLRWCKSHIKSIESVPIPSLFELDISWNIIREIHSNAFRQLTSIRKLNVSYNQLDTLPSDLFDERNSLLRSFSIRHNQLRKLPDTIFEQLRRLETLDLSDNHLRQLTERFFQRNVALENLTLARNKFTTIPATLFFGLQRLKYLSLEDNQLTYLDATIFVNQRELTVLNLGKNPLWTLPDPLLPDNNTLQTLHVSRTKLYRLKPSTLRNLRNLRNLYLIDNVNLQNLQNDTFAGMRTLKILHLNNNNFTQLPFSIVELTLDDLYLDNNPWPCDCTVQWIALWSRRRPDTIRLTANCNSTSKDLLHTLRQLHCEPIIVRISSTSYQSLDAAVRLSCEAYAQPKPAVGWLTPNGVAYVETLASSSSSDIMAGAGTVSATTIDDRTEDGDAAAAAAAATVVDLLRQHPTFANHRHLRNVRDEQMGVYLHENGDLDIKRMSREDAGEYICVAANNLGESFAYTRLFVDPSIMQRIKTGSIICGLLWVNTFLLFSVVYLLIRRYSRRAKHEKRKQRMHENMDIYKSQQISRLRERSKNQMNRIKNNCSVQVEWMKDNYRESVLNSHDHRASYLTNQYNEQMAEIREYYLTQMHQVREHYDQQRTLISEFSVNRFNRNANPSKSARTDVNCVVDATVKMENGTASASGVGYAAVCAEEEDVYRYNDTMKNEIRKLTSLRNLYEAFVVDGTVAAENITDLFGVAGPSGCDGMLNGKMRTPSDDETSDERTTMLNSKHKSLR